MLNARDNDLLTRTNKGTPMGTLFRRYWIPAMLSLELAAGDLARVEILGEAFVAWRNEEGVVGFFDEACPHRGASLALARCEQDGLRCIYHGWKFAVDGGVVEAPNAEQQLSAKVRATVYPCREAGGLIWVYLGPADKMPEFPDLPFFDAPDGHRQATKTVMRCNWLQCLEGHLDSSHAAILHHDWDPFTGKATKDIAAIIRDDRSDAKSQDIRPAIEAADLERYGFHLAALRNGDMAGQSGKFARVHCYVLPFTSVVPPRSYLFEVPVDDYNVNMYLVVWDPDKPVASLDPILGDPTMYTVGLHNDSKTFEGTAANRWFQNREAMKRNESFSGIPGFAAEDSAVVVSMGPIVDRTKEHLIATADVGVVRARRLLLAALSELEKGNEPVMPKPGDGAKMLAGEGFLPPGSNWRELVKNPEAEAVA
ncbi:MAG: Rieske 2Fe-2S domain-containing protein [Rhizobiaceae bacterium]|nr:Rieske 2Fe-2S domain-containing protein [Rhizobiaceae bacterium]